MDRRVSFYRIHDRNNDGNDRSDLFLSFLLPWKHIGMTA